MAAQTIHGGTSQSIVALLEGLKPPSPLYLPVAKAQVAKLMCVTRRECFTLI